MTELIEDVRRTIAKYNMLEYGDKIVVGVSGGPDSLCLLHVLKRLCGEYGCSIFAAHLNHQFRGKAADSDAEFVEEICKEWGIQAFIETFDVPAYIKETGLSPEEAGREIRYRLFDRVCEKVGGNKIAVAHNLNDHIETILMRFMRGSGIDGLKGIEAVRGNIIRPLLETERTRIEEYCALCGLNPRIDKTNLDSIYNRNKIRLELIPYIEKNFNPNIKTALSRFSGLIKDENDFIETEAKRKLKAVTENFDDRVVIDVPMLTALHGALQRRIIRQCIQRLSNTLNGFDFRHFEKVLELAGKSTGAAVMLPHKLKAFRSYDKLVLAKYIVKADKKCYYKLKYDYDNIIETDNGRITVKRIKAKEIGEFRGQKDIIYIDPSRIKEELVLRHRKAGDMFAPIGMKGTKKLKEYLIDEKVPREERDDLELIADGNEIVWIVGGRLSEKYKITDDTLEAVLIKYIRRSHGAGGYKKHTDK
ncbi:MAG: tRNA lysidine(34) synthetase TilS [Clostridiaceae bacterium]|jgi:tRNA(Ile)-lysidine synthase|nr:tRNA lysidine(34) synthetase TilS [Clostridiaceae bacterium]